MNKNSIVPLSRAVNAALLDTYADKGKSQILFTHFAAREFKLLDTQILKSSKRTPVLLSVNPNTRTATLPCDFEEELFVGVLVNGIKIPIKLNSSIANSKYVEDIPCEDTCHKCNANKAICEDLAITVTTTTVTINAVNYEQSVTKKMYPNGDYYLETNTPYLNIQNNVVEYITGKQFIAHIDLKPCGCVNETVANIATIQTCNPDVYCQYFAPCDTSCNINYGGYKIFPESGLIQFDYKFNFTKVYLEYKGYLIKIDGQYYIPSVAFETVVEGTKYRAIKDKRNVPEITVRRKKDDYKEARASMRQVLGRTSLANIINSILTTPKFDIYFEDYYGSCATAITPAPVISSASSTLSTSGNAGTNVIAQPTKGYVPFTFVRIVSGVDVNGVATIQDNVLIGALNMSILIVNDTTYTAAKGDFTLDNITGIISIAPNMFFNGDVVVGQYFKLL